MSTIALLIWYLPNCPPKSLYHLHSHQQWMKVPVASNLSQHLVLSMFYILAILICMLQYLIVVLICIFLMIYNIELFNYFHGISFLVRYLLRSLVHSLINGIVSFLLSFERYLYILQNSPSSYLPLKLLFFHPVAYPFILLTMSFLQQKHFILMKSSLTILSVMNYAFDVVSCSAGVIWWLSVSP